MNTLLALAAFGLIAAVTPGPNNIMLWGEGVKFGFRATLPHIIGTTIGVGTIGAATAAGLGVLVETVPQVELALKIIGSIYLLYLSYQVSGIKAVQRSDAERPLSLLQAFVFQFVNPKSWFFALSAVGSFRPPEFSIFVGSVLIVLVMMLVIPPSAAVWAASGTLINNLITNDRTRKIFSIILALALVGTVVFIWI